MIRRLLCFLFGRKSGKVPVMVYPLRRRRMVSLGIQRDPDESPRPWDRFNPGMGSQGSRDYSEAVNLGRELEGRARAESDGQEIEKLTRQFEQIQEDWDGIELKNPYE